MVVKPILNLNDHPKYIENGSLVNAVNIQIENTTNLITTENSIEDYKTLYSDIKSALVTDKYISNDNNLDIKHITNTSNELIFFIKINNNECAVIRYNEDLNKLYVAAIVDYFGGNYISEFCYNNDKLIVTFSEYLEEDSYDTVLRILDLGNFTEGFKKYNETRYIIPKHLHPICPEVNLPTCTHNFLKGYAPTGWYYCFIRYKISNHNYTQWFNLNHAIFIDSYQDKTIFDYNCQMSKLDNSQHVDKIEDKYKLLATDGNHENSAYRFKIDIPISAAKNDICNVNFKVNLNNIDTRYGEFQLGFINLRKDTTKGYITNDIKENNYIFDIHNINEYSVNDLTRTFYNYYNVKCLAQYENKLYIGNYLEHNLESTTDLKDITCSINFGNTNKTKVMSRSSTTQDNVVDMTDEEMIEKYYDSATETIRLTILNKTLNEVDRFNAPVKEVYDYSKRSDDNINTITTTKLILIPFNKWHVLLINNFGNLGHKVNTKVPDVLWDSVNGWTNTVLPANSKYKLKHVTTIERLISNGIVDSPSTMQYKLYVTNNTAATSLASPYNYDGSAFNDSVLKRMYYTLPIYNPFIGDYQPSVIVYKENDGKYSIMNGSLTSHTDDTIIIDKFGYGFSLDRAWRDIHGNIITSGGINRVFMQINTSYLETNLGFIDYDDITPSDPDNPNPPIVDPDEPDPEDPDDIIPITSNIPSKTGNILKSITNSTETLYNIFIHFVNKYGYYSNGFNINEFTTNIDIKGRIKVYENKIGNKLIYLDDTNRNIYISLDKLPDNYIGYFVTYEKLENVVKHKGFLNSIKKDNDVVPIFRNNKLQIDEAINLNFDKLAIKEVYDSNSYTTVIKDDWWSGFPNNVLTAYYKPTDVYMEANVIDSKLLASDVYNNILTTGGIQLQCNTNYNVNNLKYGKLYKELNNITVLDYYNSTIKNLIPCTDVVYTLNKYYPIRTNTSFKTNTYALIFREGTYFASGENIFMRSSEYTCGKRSDLGYQIAVGDDKVAFPVTLLIKEEYDDIPAESQIINNEGDLKVTAQTIKGTAWFSTIFECKDIYDLFKQPNFNYYEQYPKAYINNDKNIKTINKFYNTIRRSNILQNESEDVAWRKFNTEDYKLLPLNKGDITNIVSSGSIFLVHTQHTLFQYASDMKITGDEQTNKLGLASDDIFDIRYKELTPSKLGTAGVKNNYNSIIGTFGYIYYCSDDNKIYRYDGGKIYVISEDIELILKNITDINFILDVYRNRILMNLYNGSDYIKTISYNYKFNKFTSTHTYYYKGTNTKNNIYIFDDTSINTFSKVNYNNYKTDNDYSSISIVINAYSGIEFLEYIKYKFDVKNIDKFNFYSGEKFSIKTKYCYTNELNIENEDNDELNRIVNYAKPYFELGYWNYNFFRDKIKSYITNNDLISDDISRLYGDYFIITFKFSKKTLNLNCVEIEEIDCKLTNN